MKRVLFALTAVMFVAACSKDEGSSKKKPEAGATAKKLNPECPALDGKYVYKSEDQGNGSVTATMTIRPNAEGTLTVETLAGGKTETFVIDGREQATDDIVQVASCQGGKIVGRSTDKKDGKVTNFEVAKSEKGIVMKYSSKDGEPGQIELVIEQGSGREPQSRGPVAPTASNECPALSGKYVSVPNAETSASPFTVTRNQAGELAIQFEGNDEVLVTDGVQRPAKDGSKASAICKNKEILAKSISKDGQELNVKFVKTDIGARMSFAYEGQTHNFEYQSAK